ncbi:GntR family transcriptional regulator [Streptomyces sp. ME02-8801-2C]|uniref:GntR family transcriptional regulator n=1 Tax=Streptomyces sp. ME02-8801-2C TaxID=3028680 RepID=UPI0039F6AE31
MPKPCIAEQIGTGRLPVGARLPAERDLAEQYGVAVNTVRRAVRASFAIKAWSSRSPSRAPSYRPRSPPAPHPKRANRTTEGAARCAARPLQCHARGSGCSSRHVSSERAPAPLSVPSVPSVPHPERRVLLLRGR